MIYIGYVPNHNSAIAIKKDNQLLCYIEEERLSRIKRDSSPIVSLPKLIEKYVDYLKDDQIAVLYANTSAMVEKDGTTKYKLAYSQDNSYDILFKKFLKSYDIDATSKLSIGDFGDFHHNLHAMGAYVRSGLDDPLVVVLDGLGSINPESIRNEYDVIGAEIESYYVINNKQPNYINKLFTVSFNDQSDNYIKHLKDERVRFNDFYEFTASIGIGRLYESLSYLLGYTNEEAGKAMGLAPYGKENENISDFINSDGTFNLNSITFRSPLQRGEAIPSKQHIPHINEKLYGFKYEELNYDWHNDRSKLPQLLADIAYKIQTQVQEYIYQRIKGHLEGTGKTQVVLTGGIALNCVANYYIRKKLDEDFGFGKIKMFVDPIAYDGGCAIGAADAAMFMTNPESFEPKKLENLYLGFEYNYSLNDLKKYDDIIIKDIAAADVAKLISEKNIVSIYQGRSEAGPRALGNRSILYDPRDLNGTDYVNAVKKREWYRPFAGSVLHEHMHDWFDMASLDESPFMMYAVNVLPEKIKDIPAIVHVDNTCRVQTVKHNQNKYYYELIQEFYKLTGVPIIFNTSFNLAGEPLVETLDHAIKTLKNSKIEYMYMPELGKLIEVKNE